MFTLPYHCIIYIGHCDIEVDPARGLYNLFVYFLNTLYMYNIYHTRVTKFLDRPLWIKNRPITDPLLHKKQTFNRPNRGKNTDLSTDQRKIFKF